MYTGRSDHRMAAVDLAALLEGAIKLLRVTWMADCEVVCALPPEPIFVWGDSAQLRQIILNLLINSTEAHAKAVLLHAAVVRLGPGGGAAAGSDEGQPRSALSTRAAYSSMRAA